MLRRDDRETIHQFRTVHDNGCAEHGELFVPTLQRVVVQPVRVLEQGVALLERVVVLLKRVVIAGSKLGNCHIEKASALARAGLDEL